MLKSKITKRTSLAGLQIEALPLIERAITQLHFNEFVPTLDDMDGFFTLLNEIKTNNFIGLASSEHKMCE